LPRDPRGFTLVELMIVLAIMSLAVGLALPLLAKRAPAAALGGATQQVRAALTAARWAAIAEDREVVFTGDYDGYRIDGAHHPLVGGDLRVELRGGARLSFFPSGGSSGGRVVLRAGAGQREIAVDAVTGRAILLP
jgi:general secretion pathway protein H